MDKKRTNTPGHQEELPHDTHLTLTQIKKQFGIPIRKLSYLVRIGELEAVSVRNKLYVAEDSVRAYLNLPEKVHDEHHQSYLKTLGPGLITGASDDDPSGIGTYSQIGAAYGLSFAWLALYSIPMMIGIQETSARIGIVTRKGLARAIGDKFGKKVLYPILMVLLVANTINIGADLGAMVASLQMLIPLHFIVGVIVLALVITFLEVFIPYQKYARILKWLTLVLLAYIITCFVIKPDWGDVIHHIAFPQFEITGASIAAIVAFMGTTITPYLFFWQAAQEVEESSTKQNVSAFEEPDDTQPVVIAATKSEVREMRKDTATGMALSNIVALFIIVTTATVLHANGVTNINSAQQAASALEPIAGRFAYLLFTCGIFGVGLLAIPVIAGSSAYAVAEVFGWKEGLGAKFRDARKFYLVIIVSMAIGVLLNILGINPISALYYAAIINGIAAPIIIVFILLLGADKSVMGEFTNPLGINIVGWIACVLMSIAAVVVVILSLMGIGP